MNVLAILVVCAAAALAAPTDLSGAYYASLANPSTKNLCSFAQKANGKDLAELFYAVTIASADSSCKINFPEAESTALGVIAAPADAQSLYRAAVIASHFAFGADASKVVATVQKFLEGQASPATAGYAFSSAALLVKVASKLAPISTEVEDIVSQAEESGEGLAFDGSLGATVIALRGIYDLAAATKKAPAVTAKQATQFAKFLLSNKHVHSNSDAATLAVGFRTLSNNDFHVPLLIQAEEAVLTSSSKTIQVVAGPLVDSDANVAVEATIDGTSVSGAKFSRVGQTSTFALDLSSANLKAGSYVAKVTVKASGSKFISSTANVAVTVTTAVSLADVDVSRDGSFGKSSWSVAYPKALAEKLEFDDRQNFVAKFKVVDAAGATVVVNQAFLTFKNKETGKIAYFVAELLSTKSYAIDFNLKKEASFFNYASGSYEVALLIGDKKIEKSIQWTFGEVAITFKDQAPAVKSTDNFSILPEINHVFRVPDERAPDSIGFLFALLTLSPAVLLIALWAKLGANVSDISITPSSIVFHLSFAAIIYLYVLFFCHLNMFQVLKTLVILLPIAGISGKYTLSAINARRIAKSA